MLYLFHGSSRNQALCSSGSTFLHNLPANSICFWDTCAKLDFSGKCLFKSGQVLLFVSRTESTEMQCGSSEWLNGKSWQLPNRSSYCLLRSITHHLKQYCALTVNRKISYSASSTKWSLFFSPFSKRLGKEWVCISELSLEWNIELIVTEQLQPS